MEREKKRWGRVGRRFERFISGLKNIGSAFISTRPLRIKRLARQTIQLFEKFIKNINRWR